MNKQIKTLFLVILLIAVMVGATIFYNAYSGGGSNLIVSETTASLDTDTNAVSDDEKSTIDGETLAESDDEATAAENADEAPDFTLLDADGSSVSLSDYIGKPIVINFWASWCAYCVREMPDFEEAYEKYGGDVMFMMVNVTDGVKETTEIAKAFIADKGYDFPIFFDTQSEAQIAFGVSSYPTTFFISEDGNVAAYGRGMLNSDTLNKGIAMIYDAEY